MPHLAGMSGARALRHLRCVLSGMPGLAGPCPGAWSPSPATSASSRWSSAAVAEATAEENARSTAGASPDACFSWARSLGGLGAALAFLVGERPGGSVKGEVRKEKPSPSRLYPADLEQFLKPSVQNPSPVSVPPPFPGLAQQQWSVPHVAPIFGLPMRGKAHVARELKRYIQFFHGARAEVFEVSNYLGPGGDEKLLKDLAHFFRFDKNSAVGKESAYSFEAEAKESGGFAIILANDEVESTQSMWSAHTKWHRRWMAKEVGSELGAEVCFIQINVDEVAGQKYVEDLARHRGMDLMYAKATIAEYQDHYVPIVNDGSESDVPYVQLLGYGKTIVVNQFMRTFVGAEVCHFLACLHPYQHTIYLSRHGESTFNIEKRLGGDSSLSPRGKEYARRLAEFVDYVVCGHASNLVCATVSSEEARQLAKHLLEGSADHEGTDRAVFSRGSWSGYGDASGGIVLEGMRLVRMQADYGNDFVDAPHSVDGVVSSLGSSSTTLVFVEGDTSRKGQVPGRLWTSSLRRTIETAGFVRQTEVAGGPNSKPWRQMLGRKFRNLDEVYAGEYDGLTVDEIQQKAPDVLSARSRDKLGFRYPRGESYYDVLARLESVMCHLERVNDPLLIISHQAVLRMILGWLLQKSRTEAIDLEVPQHDVIRIKFDGLGGPRVETRFPLGPTRLPDDGRKVF